MPRVKVPKTALPPRIQRIITRRQELGLTQEELARMAGFSTSLMAKIERGAADPRVLSAERLVGLARALGMPLSVLLDEETQEEGPAPIPIPTYASLHEALEGTPSQQAFLTAEELPRGAHLDRLGFLQLPGPWLFSPTLPFPIHRPLRLLVELRPLLSPEGVYLGRVQDQAALFTEADLRKEVFPLYPLAENLPTLWVRERPEVLGLVRGWRMVL